MTQIELAQKFEELDVRVRGCFTEALDLIKEYDRTQESATGLRNYHAVENFIYDMVLNGAHIADEWQGKNCMDEKSITTKCKKILAKNHI